MSFSSGTYSLPGPALNTGDTVSATENNTFRNDVATAFNLTWLRDGTAAATANIPMGGFKLTGLGAATTSGDALSYGQAATVSTLTATSSVSAPNTFGFKNRIINGAMMIDQRNAGAAVTPAAIEVYTLDRFYLQSSQASKFNIQRNAGSVSTPAGFRYYLGATTASAVSIASGDYFNIIQAIEGYNINDLAWGTASAAPVTLSFWVRSSLTGTFGGSLRNSAANRSYPFTYTISNANTWEQKSITIAGDTSGSWAVDNAAGIYLTFGLGVGSTYSGTAGSWAGVNYASATGATSVVGTSGATFYITGVQLEKGSTATSFDYRPYGTELALCQRYYYINRGNGSTATQVASGVVNTSSRVNFVGASLPVSMRALPSVSITGGYFYDGNTTSNFSSTAYTSSTLTSITFDANCASAVLTIGRFAGFGINPTTDKVEASAEL